MIPDGEYTAVLDRFEDDQAVLVVEADGRDRYELVVEEGRLPSEARHADAVLTIEVSDGDLTAASYEPDPTSERAERAQDRFDRLAERPPRDDEAG